MLPGRNDAEMGPANSLLAVAYYCEYNERFDLILMHFGRQATGGIRNPRPRGYATTWYVIGGGFLFFYLFSKKRKKIFL